MKILLLFSPFFYSAICLRKAGRDLNDSGSENVLLPLKNILDVMFFHMRCLL